MAGKQASPFDNFDSIDSKILRKQQFLRKSSSVLSLTNLPANNEFDSPNVDDWSKFQPFDNQTENRRQSDPLAKQDKKSTSRRQSDFDNEDNDLSGNKRSQSGPVTAPKPPNPTEPSKPPADDLPTKVDTASDGESDIEDDTEYQWDVARNVPWEEVSPSEACLPCLKALKFAVYGILLVIILICSVVSQSCMLLLLSSLAKPSTDIVPYRENGIKQLIWITCIPHVLVFLISFLKSCFGNLPWPSAGQFFVIVGVELLHTLGLTLLVFRVLSAFDSMYALGLMYVLGILPLIVKLIFARRRHTDVRSTATCALTLIVDSLCLAVQLGAVILSVYQLVATNNRSLNYRWASTTSLDFATDTSRNYMWQIPLALVLVSVKWWENFVDTDRGCLRLFAFKRVCKDVRTKMETVTSVTAIVATIGLVYLLEYVDGRQLSTALLYGDPRTNSTQVQQDVPTPGVKATQVSSPTEAGNVTANEPIIIRLPDMNWELAVGIAQALAAAVAYFCSTLACKLRMQQVSFCVPIYLATPMVAMLVALQCTGIMPSLPIFGRLQYEMICPVSYSAHYLQLTACGCYWLSALWLTSYIWFPKAERLAFAEKLWVKRLYIGTLAIPSLLMNRRRNDLELRRTREGTYVMASASSNSSSSNNAFDDVIDDNSQDTQDSNLTPEEGPSGTAAPSASEDQPVPMIYACATMWHEEEDEMKALFKSIFRMDKDQCIRRLAKETFKTNDPDYYEFEAHILFDDCMELNDDDKWVANKYVRQVTQCLHEAASLVSKEQKEMPPPIRMPTPYGGRLKWKLPGGNNLIIHLKDKNKIRHRKRWSQCMYMYYLLGYRLFEEYQDPKKRGEAKPFNSQPVFANSRSALTRAQITFGYFAKSEILNHMDEDVIARAANTFVLALDGDVDFKPDAVRLLVDRMKRNPKTGAACGRIHPTGSGPMVWYQLFEYAIGHWFQKATEHILGCVLCSPGCFSLFRGLALLDDNVMKMYTKNVEKATDYLQCDQGEDRWLCTLLLKQGHRVDYTAASDALTHAPEGFDEFFNQRRRWMPSTMANIMDLLGDWQITVRVNDNISYFYIIYQFLLMISTILGPATIILAIAQSFLSVLGVDILVAYALAIGPVLGYIFICFYFKPKIQLLVAKILCAFFAAIMLGVFVGTLHVIVTSKNLDPGFIFLALLTFSFIFAGAMHPYEFFCLTHGILYFLSVPAGYLVLVIYSLSNMNSVSWGTREVERRKTPAELKAEAEKKLELEKRKQKKKGCFSFLNVQAIIAEIKDFIVQLVPQKTHSVAKAEDESLTTQKAILKQIRGMVKLLKKKQHPEDGSSDSDDDDIIKKVEKGSVKDIPAVPPPAVVTAPVPPAPIAEVALDDIDDPDWLKYSEDLGDGEIERLSDNEREFWVKFVRKYLKPLDKNKKHEEEMKKKLAELRTSSSMAYWFINFLWVLLSFMLNKDNNLNTISFKVAGTQMTTQPFGFVFLLFFVLVLVLQMISMVLHRWGTFMQLMSITELARPRWARRLGRSGDGEKSVPSASEAISIVTKIVDGGGFDDPLAFDAAFDPPSVKESVNKPPAGQFDYSPEEIYRTLRGYGQTGNERRGRGHRDRPRHSPDDTADPYGANNHRRGRYAKAGERGGDDYRNYDNRRASNDRYGPTERNHQRMAGDRRPRSGYRSRRYAAGDQFADNFRRQLGTIMQRQRR